MINILQNAKECKLDGIYRAYVVDDEDPRDVGRVRVRIPGVYLEDVFNEHLPWALPATGISRSGGTNVVTEDNLDLSEDDLKKAFNKTGTGGIFCVPARGNHVWVWFDNGNHMQPIYFASAPNEDDWRHQKKYLKDKIDKKLKQIKTLAGKFKPEDGKEGILASDWAKSGYVNTRQGLITKGEGLIVKESKTNKFKEGKTKIKGTEIEPVKLNISKEDKQGKESKNMTKEVDRAIGTAITMDVKPLFDKEEEGKRTKKEFGKLEKGGDGEKDDKGGDAGKNVNRYVTSFTTLGGTTIVVDNREGQENFYLIHKNYMENIDQNGSRKVFIGRNDPENENDIEFLEGEAKEAYKKTRSSDELAVDGDKKIHVLGDFVTYAKGNIFTQCDRNMQIDVNDSCGLRIKKGDFDIIIEGSEDTTRDEDSERDEGKEKQKGDLNIDIQKGKMEIHVKESANIHVEGQCNLKVDSDLKMTTKKDFHLHVGGSYHEYIVKNKFSTVVGKTEIHLKGEVKTYAESDVYKEILGGYQETITKEARYKFDAGKSVKVKKDDILDIGGSYSNKTGGNVEFSTTNYTIGGDKFGTKCATNILDGTLDVKSDAIIGGSTKIGGALDVVNVVTTSNVMTPSVNLNAHEHKYIDDNTADTYPGGSPKVAQNKTTLSKTPTGNSPSPAFPKSVTPNPLAVTEPLTAKNDGGGKKTPEFYDKDEEKANPDTEPDKNQTVTAIRTKKAT